MEGELVGCVRPEAIGRCFRQVRIPLRLHGIFMTTQLPPFTGTPTYLCSDELAAAVNVSIALERPLLIKGEPGTGKTLLAESIAEFYGLKLLRWSVKSTTRAQDGLYQYDTVARLNDSRFGDRDVRDIRQYIRYGALGQAFLSEERVVLLIDEIDKADLEFPNDLLHELDRMSFHVDEINEEVVARHRPIVLLTSNNEKELPDAFLRRCVFHFIAFPEDDLLKAIVRVHHPDLEDALLTEATRRFQSLRGMQNLRKRPSTSELIDWVAALRRSGLGVDVLQERLPFLGVLLKHEDDLQRARLPERPTARGTGGWR